jgi:thimet oligopeptidase
VHRLWLALAFTVAGATAPAGAQSPLPSAPAAPALDFRLSAVEIAQACSAQLARLKSRTLHLEHVAPKKRTFGSVIMPLENISADANDTLAAAIFLYNVSPDKAVRSASQQCNDRLAALESALLARPTLFAVVLDAAHSNTATTTAARKLTELTVVSMRRSGAALSESKRILFVDDAQQLTELETKFQTRLANDATTIPLSADEAKSLPPDFVAGLKPAAAGYSVPVDESHYLRYLRNESSEAARERFLVAYDRRGGPENVATLQRALTVRDAMAHLLGYKSWAAYTLSDRMAKSPQRVDTLLSSLSLKLSPLAQSELMRLQDRKRSETGDPAAVINAWDQAYYANRILLTDYALDRDALREYFPAAQTIDGVLAIYSNLLGVTFTPIQDAPAWADDVIAYRVADATGGADRGVLYLDLYPRPGKYTHFATFGILPVRTIGGTLRPGVSAIVGNWARPAPGRPATLSHDELETFFHEFGQAMADLLNEAPYESLSNGYRWDFVEAPSQMLENWVWDPATLKALSTNVKTGKSLPDATIAKLVAVHHFNEATSWLTQVTYSRIDLAYHSGPHVDTSTVWRREFATTPLPGAPPGAIPQASFEHFMGGYDAGYYSYVWSEVYAQDMFSVFKTAGLMDPAVGMRYRADILAPGRTYEPDVLVQRFLGRPVSEDAFLGDFTPAQSPSPTQGPTPK